MCVCVCEAAMLHHTKTIPFSISSACVIAFLNFPSNESASSIKNHVLDLSFFFTLPCHLLHVVSSLLILIPFVLFFLSLLPLRTFHFIIIITVFISSPTPMIHLLAVQMLTKLRFLFVINSFNGFLKKKLLLLKTKRTKELFFFLLT